MLFSPWDFVAPKFAKQKVTVKKLETLMKDFIWWSLVQMDFVSLPQLQSCHLEHQEEVYNKKYFILIHLQMK